MSYAPRDGEAKELFSLTLPANVVDEQDDAEHCEEHYTGSHWAPPLIVKRNRKKLMFLAREPRITGG